MGGGVILKEATPIIIGTLHCRMNVISQKNFVLHVEPKYVINLWTNKSPLTSYSNLSG